MIDSFQTFTNHYHLVWRRVTLAFQAANLSNARILSKPSVVDSVSACRSTVHNHIFITTAMKFSQTANASDLVRFEVLTATNMNMDVFLDLEFCSLTEIHRRFRGAYCLHYQGNVPEDSLSSLQAGFRSLRRDQLNWRDVHSSFSSVPPSECEVNCFTV
jgi:hypothetical protein